jgi:glycosyltransferase involved in cell wall biosynthesis
MAYKKKILITAYDVDPYKGSESGFGWNMIFQASRYNHIIAITRKNNRSRIEEYIKQNDICTDNLVFYYFDLPYYLRFWKVGPRGSTLYFYLWQMFIVLFIAKEKITFDIAHNLNFSTDSIPSFLWIFNKPFIWGPINHHEKIHYEYLRPYGYKSLIRDRLSWIVKLYFWNIDPFNKISKYRADIVLGGNKSVQKRLGISDKKFILFPTSGSPYIEHNECAEKQEFNILVAARFVPLKGVDIAINAVIKFIQDNPEVDDVTLTIIGKGPQEALIKEISKGSNNQSIFNFVSWIELEELIQYYRRSSLFLFPSHEGAGMVVVEAMSHGLPVVCFDNYGPGEMVDENSGIKITYSNYDKSVNDFAEAIKDLYTNNGLMERLSKGSRKRYEERYTWDAKGEYLKEVYNRINSY